MLTHGQFGKDGWPPWGPWTPTHQVPTYCGWASEILRQLIDGLPSGKHAQNYRKSPFFMGKSTISIAIFNSYVKLPEGKSSISRWHCSGNKLLGSSQAAIKSLLGTHHGIIHHDDWRDLLFLHEASDMVKIYENILQMFPSTSFIQPILGTRSARSAPVV